MSGQGEEPSTAENATDLTEKEEELEGAVGGTSTSSPPRIPPKHPPHAFVKYMKLPKVEVEVVDAPGYVEYKLGSVATPELPEGKPRPRPSIVPRGDFDEGAGACATRPGTPRPIWVPAEHCFVPLDVASSSSTPEWNYGEDDEVQVIFELSQLNVNDDD